MKKIVLTFGLIAGAIMSVLMFATIPFADRIGFDYSLLVGYTTMVLAFLLVFFGIRSYRENVGGGQISFGRAVSVGILIVLIASVMYVIAWEILYYNFIPDFADKYTAHLLEKARAAGASPEQLAVEEEKMKSMRWMLDNPFINGAVAFVEPLPVGIVLTLVSAAILRKRHKEPQTT
ncbi:MAG TPA: DUF4199 domain-containing protein [Pyrinomonadaceae bacterium]